MTKSFASAGAIYTVSSALNLAAAILILPVLTRALPASSFGQVAVCVVVTNVVSALARMGLPPVITRIYFDPDGAERARQLVWVNTVAGAVVVLVIEVTAPLWSTLFSSLDYDLALRAAVWTALPATTLTALTAVLRGARRPVAFGVVSVSGSVGARVAALGALAIWDTVGAYFVAVLVATAGVAVVAALSSGLRSPLRLGRSAALSTLLLALPVLPHDLGLYFLAASDRVVLERYATLADVGKYQVAYTIGALLITGLVSVGNAWAPLVYAAEEDRGRVAAASYYALQRGVAIGVSGLALVLPAALWLAGGEAYATERFVDVGVIVTLAALPYLSYAIGTVLLVAEKQTAGLLYATPVAAMANVALNVALVDRHGVIAAAWTTLLTYGLLAVLVRLRARRYVAVPWDRSESLRSYSLAIAIAAVAITLPLDNVGITSARVVIGGALSLVGIVQLLRGMRELS